MQDYTKQLMQAINQYDPESPLSIEHLRDLVCWISDDTKLKEDPIIAQLLYIASQKMRVFGYNALNHLQTEPEKSGYQISSLCNSAVTNLYRSQVNSQNLLDKSQKEVVDIFQSADPHRLLVSAPTSYGKTFLMREIVFLNKDRYKNILLVFPTVALLLENAQEMSRFIQDHNLNYDIVKTVDDIADDENPKIFVFTPERALQLIASFPDLKIDFFFFDEVYKIDEDYCSDPLDEHGDEGDISAIVNPKQGAYHKKNFLDENRGKTFRIALYLLAKSVDDYYLAGPNLNKDQFGPGLRRFIKYNHITVKEITFEPTLRITVNAYTSHIEEKLPEFVDKSSHTELVPISKKVNERIESVVSYIKQKNYGKTLLYCTTPAKAIEYSGKLSQKHGAIQNFENYPEDFKRFFDHVKKEYDVENSVEQWSLVKVLKNGYGMHHGKLPKYIQREILEQFNRGTFNILFCTSTIVEGVNTDAQNMIILNTTKGGNKLTPFDIKNIKGRAGRYYHCFIGRVFYTSKELCDIENSSTLSLDFATYSDKPLDAIDLDNAELADLTTQNAHAKSEREKKISQFLLPEELFVQNRTITREYQEQLLEKLMEEEEYNILRPLLLHDVQVETFLKYRWINKILKLFISAGLIDELTEKRYSAVANNYYEKGFKGLLQFEISQYKKGKIKSVDKAYSEAFNSVKDILEHRIPKILSLFESIAIFVAEQNGDAVAPGFSLSKVRRYYETGVKSLLGEALIEYGFPTDAIRRIEKQYPQLLRMNISEAKQYCRKYYHAIFRLLDTYEQDLFSKAMRTF